LNSRLIAAKEKVEEAKLTQNNKRNKEGLNLLSVSSASADPSTNEIKQEEVKSPSSTNQHSLTVYFPPVDQMTYDDLHTELKLVEEALVKLNRRKNNILFNLKSDVEIEKMICIE
jgi:hypothetical protein